MGFWGLGSRASGVDRLGLGYNDTLEFPIAEGPKHWRIVSPKEVTLIQPIHPKPKTLNRIHLTEFKTAGSSLGALAGFAALLRTSGVAEGLGFRGFRVYGLWGSMGV